MDRIERLNDSFRNEIGLAKFIGLKRLPFSTTLQRYLHRHSGFNINQLLQVNYSLIKNNISSWYNPHKTLFVDIDMNVKPVEGKHHEKANYGYNPNNMGRHSLKMSLVYVCGLCLYLDLHKGSQSEVKLLKEQVDKTKSILKKKIFDSNFKFKNLVFRVDGGYVTYENINYLVANNYKFLTRLKINSKPLKQHIKNIKIEDSKNPESKKWKVFNNSNYQKYKDLGEIEFKIIDKENNEEYLLDTKLRVVIVRLKRITTNKKITKYIYYPIATNLLEFKPLSIIKAYRKRQHIENSFRELNQAFNANKLPSTKYNSNKAYLVYTIIAYNSFFFFQKHPTNKSQKIPKIHTSKNSKNFF